MIMMMNICKSLNTFLFVKNVQVHHKEICSCAHMYIAVAVKVYKEKCRIQ